MKTYTITKEQLRSLTDPKVKGMFPGAFDSILEEGNWYKSEYGDIAFCKNLIEEGPHFTGYCAWPDGNFEYILEFVLYKGWQLATNEEVFEALERAAIKMGYKKGLYCFFEKDKNIRAIDKDGFSMEVSDYTFFIGSDCIFQNGEWAEIVNKKLL
jgi:hypothetical protein